LIIAASTTLRRFDRITRLKRQPDDPLALRLGEIFDLGAAVVIALEGPQAHKAAHGY
jgi:hypothetical protein